MHGRKTAQLLVRLLAHGGRQFGLVEGLAQFVHVVGLAVAGIAQFVTNGLELFAQEVFLLGLVHALAGRALDLGLHGGHFHLAVQLGIDEGQPLEGIDGFKDALGVLRIHADIGGHEVGQTARLGDALQDAHHVGRGHAAQLEHFFAFLAGGAQEGLHGGVVARDRFADGFDMREQVGILPVIGVDARPAQALHEDFDPTVGHLEHAHDLHDGAHVIEVGGGGIFSGFVALGADEQVASFLEGGLHGGHGFVAPDEEGQDHVAEDDHITQGQHGQLIGNLLQDFGPARVVRIGRDQARSAQHVAQRLFEIGFAVRHRYISSTA